MGRVSSRPALPCSPTPGLSDPPQSLSAQARLRRHRHPHRNAWLMPLTSKDKAGFPDNQVFYHLICGCRLSCGFGSLSPESQLDGVTSASLSFCFKGNGPLCNACFVADAAEAKLWGQGQDEVAGDEEASVLFRMLSCLWLLQQKPCGCLIGEVPLWLRVIGRNSAELEKRTGQKNSAQLRSQLIQLVGAFLVGQCSLERG